MYVLGFGGLVARIDRLAAASMRSAHILILCSCFEGTSITFAGVVVFVYNIYACHIYA